ncbi:ATP synthase subunit alpha [Quillaja saponaria]|uniref:ATP synthase subunit alpha n=1 Tax=Quillaja saponaria TaxID=32244 RepID=A0AAD7KKC5_QUISA|nr:ATP synthase subunit alpha [Quillaja saponaria]
MLNVPWMITSQGQAPMSTLTNPLWRRALTAPGTTTQLSGAVARSTTEQISPSLRASRWGPAMGQKREKPPSLSFLFSGPVPMSLPCGDMGAKKSRRRRKEDFHLKFKTQNSHSLPFWVGSSVKNQNTQQALALPEKEVIQPHLPVRLPCYDFTPVTSPAFGIPLLAVKLGSFHRLSRVEPWDLTADLKSHLQTLYAQSFRITLASSAFYLHAALLRQAFAHCGKFPTAASRRSLGRVSVPVWLIILSDQLLIIALPFPAVVPLPRAGSYALLTRPPLETPLPVRLACVKHAASVHPEPGSNSP